MKVFTFSSAKTLYGLRIVFGDITNVTEEMAEIVQRVQEGLCRPATDVPFTSLQVGERNPSSTRGSETDRRRFHHFLSLC